jgi:uncharacterized protein (DUF433 family)
MHYRSAAQAVVDARPYANRGPLRGKTVHARAAAELRSARSELHKALLAAVASGTTQAAARRVAGLSSAQTSRLVRGATSGKIELPRVRQAPLADRLPVQEILTRYQAGESSDELGQAFGCSGSSIRRLLASNGVPLRPPRRRSTVLPISDEEMARRYIEDRATAKGLAAEFGVKPHLISRRLAKAGVHVPVGQRRLALPDDEIVQRVRNGEPVSRVAAAYGISFPSVKRRIRWDDAKTA